MCKAFEQAVIAHCAPTLAGHKCASLFAWRGCGGSRQAECVEEADQVLRSKGVRVRGLPNRTGGLLVLVYRPGLLCGRLAAPGVRDFLQEQGYADGSLGQYLAQLADRLAVSKGFPHEIGIFLDYPLEDVQGFMENRGAGCACQGCWKVYGDAQEACRRFLLYRKCREVYLACYHRGFDVLRLTVAA